MRLKYGIVSRFLMVLLLAHFSISLFPQNFPTYEFYDCKMIFIKPSQYKRFKPATDIMEELRKALEKAGNCFSRDTYNKIINDLMSRPLKIQIACDLKDKCAEVWQLRNLSGDKGRLMFVSVDFWDNDDINDYNNGCGCLKSKLLHELLHWSAGLGDSDKEEVEAYSCEVKCYGADGEKNCPVIPKKYKDRVKPERCCK